jgi:hypothetical protein
MKPTAAILALVFIGAVAHATDLTKIDRTIAKQPVYQTKTPKYCLLVFGPEAKLRVWLVLDGNVLYVDRDANGDLTGLDKRMEIKGKVFESASLRLADGKIPFSFLQLRVKDKGRVELSLARKVAFAHRKKGGGFLSQMVGPSDISSRAWANNLEEFDFQFADRPQDAPILHFDGPLTLKPTDAKQVFVRGDKPAQFAVMVGTPGLGRGTFTQVLFWQGDPDGAAEIVFPNKDPEGKPIVVKVVLQSPS